MHRLLELIDPWLWYAAAAGWFIGGVFSLFPMQARDDAPAREHFLCLIRRLASALVVFSGLIGVGVWGWGLKFLAPGASSEWWGAMSWRYGWGVVGAGLLGVGIRILFGRYLWPLWSDRMRSLRQVQRTDEMSDIRKDSEAYKSRVFDPAPFYETDNLFLGLTPAKTPYRISWDVFRSTHMQIVGETGAGKGVLLQNIFAQAIPQRFGVWYLNPKPDRRVENVLAHGAEQAGVPFIILDLVDGVGHYVPFRGGTSEERVDRMTTAAMLEESGSAADYHKIGEQRIVWESIEHLGPSETTLEAMMRRVVEEKNQLFRSDPRKAGALTSLESMLYIWGKNAQVSGPERPDTLDVAKAIEQRAVVYVRCALGNTTTKITSNVLLELMQCAMRNPPSARGEHLFVVIDEAASLISKTVMDGLTAVRSSGVTIGLAYQLSDQMRNLADKRIDADAAKMTVEINCATRFLHGTDNSDAAKEISDRSGTIAARRLAMEGLEVVPFGGEVWGDQRSIREEEAPYIHPNVVKMLQPRVAIAFSKGQLATPIYTCWVKTPADAYAKAVERQRALVPIAIPTTGRRPNLRQLGKPSPAATGHDGKPTKAPIDVSPIDPSSVKTDDDAMTEQADD